MGADGPCRGPAVRRLTVAVPTERPSTGEGAAPGAGGPEQLTLPGLAPPRKRARKAGIGGDALVPAENLPVAQVVVDVPAAHLDRTFDYLVPATMDAGAQPGVRVKVRFGAQDLDGFVVSRSDTSGHDGRLSPLRRVVSTEQVLSPETLALCRAVANHYAGSLADVLRLAVPPRHARTEAEPHLTTDVSLPPARDLSATERNPWAAYGGGEAFLRHLAEGGAPRAVWTALPGRWSGEVADPSVAREGWEELLVDAVLVARHAGRGALVVLPDKRDVDRLSRALDAAGLVQDAPGHARGHYVRLLADDGVAQRYRSFLALSRGEVSLAIGTRAAAFAPVPDLGLAVCWDDLDQSHAEARSPYPHTREVLALRSELTGCALLVGSTSRSVEAQALLGSGWAREIAASRDVVRARAPRVRAMTSAELAVEGPGAAARIPSAAWRFVRDGLAHGPVLVQVPRRGYIPVVACQQCREPSRCAQCHGPLGLPADGGAPQCTWCGRLAAAWRCSECDGTALRSVQVGSQRTAEELGRAFPGVTVKVSGAGTASGVIDLVTATPALVVSTPGAEPVAAGGYAACLLLDAAVLTFGTGLRVRQDALHRWISAASLTREPAAGGRVMVVGDGDPVVSGALVRWDPAGLAARDLEERAELGLPPALRVGALTGSRPAVEAMLARLSLPDGGGVLGPITVSGAGGPGTPVPAALLGDDSELVRAIVRVPRGQGRALALALKEAVAVRGARRETGHVHVQMDVAELV